uniref:DUF4605 domain-containing protein n=1 Tax=Angiostrongylus cantonensis TaxID=6313 RepID=A0A0K0DL21_ANGCA
MVRILSNGEVVSEDDPRGRQRPNPGRSTPGPNRAQNTQNQADVVDNLTSIWNTGNDRLRQMGLQTIHVGSFRVDPLHLVAAVLGFLLSGPMMLAVIVAIILVSQTRSDNAVSVQQSSLGGSERGHYSLSQRGGLQRNGRAEEFGPFLGTGKRLGN